MPAHLRLREGTIVVPDDELTWRFSRSGGPGGQHVNTTDTRVEVGYDVRRSRVLTDALRDRALTRLSGRLVDGVLTVVSAEHRSQHANRRTALERLTATLEEALAPPPRARRPTRPSRASGERRLSAKKRRGDTKRLRRTPPTDG